MPFLQEYTMLDELGKGGFATVYKVRHDELGYIRAIRVLNETIVDASSPTYQKFLRECKLLLRLGNGNHPNIVHIYQPRLLDNKALVEMDFVDGLDILHYLKQQQNFVPVEEVIRMAMQMSSALAYCHEDIYRFCMDRDLDNLQDDPNDGSKVLLDDETRQHLIAKYKVIHNDIHSGNIMRREDGNFVLLDFGLAINGEEVVRSSRRKNGAPEFKAPEKWNDESILTEQSDIYSFGIVLYQYLAGRVPFPYNTQVGSHIAEYELAQSHQKAMLPSIEALRKEFFEKRFKGQEYKKDYPQWLEDVILKCLRKDPTERFRDGKELYDFVVENTIKMDNSNDIPNVVLTELENLNEANVKLTSEVETLRGINKSLNLVLTEKQNTIQQMEHALENAQIQIEALKDELNHCLRNEQPLQDSKHSSINRETKDTITSGKDIVVTVKGVSFVMKPVFGGSFQMGMNSAYDGDGDKDETCHFVKVSGFYMGETVVTRKLWNEVMGTSPSHHKDDNLPVENVSWEDCRDFISHLNTLTGNIFRLPTEAEWEYAARGGIHHSETKFSGSNEINDVAWYNGNSSNTPHPVKLKMPNELGLYDMSGNVWEWCEDWYGNYNNTMQTDPTGPTQGTTRVLRGGCWDTATRGCRVAYRCYGTPTIRNHRIGCRLVLNLIPKK